MSAKRFLTMGCSFVLMAVVTLPVAQSPGQTTQPNAPLHYYFDGQPTEMNLDAQRLAVLYRAEPGQRDVLMPTDSFGIEIDRVEPTPVTGWALLDLSRPLSGATDARSRLDTMADSPDVEFVSPVFFGRDGGPVIIAPEILIRLKDEHADKIDALLADIEPSLRIIKSNFGNFAGGFILRGSDRNGFDVLARANRLALDSRVLWAEPDMQFTGRGGEIPNDTGFANCWGHRNTGQFGGVAGEDMDSDLAWDMTLGSSDVKVLILDTGVQQDHPDINQLPGNDFTSDASTDGGPVNVCDNHGTAVAGCVSAIINNNLGTVGMAPGCKVISARFSISNLSCDGSWSAFSSWIANAITWGETQGARVSNDSNQYGGLASSAINNAYASTRANGMIHFASAGNFSSSTITYPSSLSTVNAVAALNNTGVLASFSNWGVGLAFSAPGESIYTTDRTGAAGWVSGDYVFANGTSFASPYTAGIAALVLSQSPSLNVDEVEAIMQSTSRDLGDPGYDTDFGWGFVNANDALSIILDCNSNGVPDSTDIAGGTSTDCNANLSPDECEGLPDCQPNGVPDVCDLVLGTDVDCNVNAVPDGCDISSGTSDDADTDGVPDECQASVLYVDGAGRSARNGTSWANAYTELVDALAVASNPANSVSEIWVAAGTYKPDKGSGDRSATFQLVNGLAVYGGFAGTETLLTERDPAVNVSILDGDIGTPADASDNTYQVVDASGTDATAVLDGVVIRNGNADGAMPLNRGGGLHIDNGTPTIRNCRFEDNHAEARGGALYNEFGTGATVSGCTFEGNTSEVGGAVYVRQSSPVLTSCVFRSNSATVRGGAVHVVSNAAPVLVNCTFVGNTSPLGGALSNNNGAIVANCTFTENVASNHGGAVYQTTAAGSLTLENSVLWNNSDASGTDETGQLTVANGSATVRYSCIQNYSGAGVDGNIAVDPLFVDADGADNTAGTADDDMRLQAGSPAIDAGDNSAVPGGVTTDLDGIPRFVDDPETTDSGNGTPPIVDMGAHEYPGCSSTCGDIDGSGGNVDLVDFASFAVCFNALPSSSAACACSDLNLDGVINLLDFATLSLIFNGSSTNVPPNCP